MEIKKIKETCLYVKDLNRTQKFYEEKLGLTMIGKIENRHVFFRAGSSVLLCFNAEVTKNDTELPPHFGSGNIHLAFEVDIDEYEGWKQKIIENNIQILKEKIWKPGISSFYFHDPDEHVLEIVVPGMWE